ncbi:hypothetical protein B0T18DRAFT_427309 [Schizothecium vesticola]|uniref:RING-type domain-containing protein n=1 Tax=Schizothecium vesticola TaxID=314040 RepID=A0AA40F1E5_9PEZI|nr:hypothetical protein B0T18DRAFT_427309 [Schizothecium vesticola]
MGVHQEAVVAGPASSSKRKRKQADASPSADNQHQSPAKKAKKQADADTEEKEKRLRRFRPNAPKAFQEIYERATTQRFYVLRANAAAPPKPLKKRSRSLAPPGAENKQCKHIIYVMARVLRANPDHVYQLALLSSELCDIFVRAPPADNQPGANGAGNDNNRKPLEGDCPICFNEMEAEGEAVVWCKAACGQNVHRECFEMWAATKRQQAGAGGKVDVTCPYCRSVWEGDEDMVKKIEKTGPLNTEGYVNVAEQLGISDQRDPSIYSRWWKGHPRAYRRRT